MKVFFRGINSCVMRKTDIARYRKALEENGHQIVDTPEESDTIAVWTCAFRGDFRDNSIRILNEYQQLGKKVIACGCLPSIDLPKLKEGFDGDSIEWKNEREGFLKIFGISPKLDDRPLVERALDIPIDEFKKQNPHIKTTHTDQFIKLFVSEGCPFDCTYCAEIKAFPPYKSFPLNQLVEQCKDIVEQSNEKRVALFGDCIGEYGTDNNSSFAELLDRLVSDVEGIRLSLKNLHPLHWLNHFDVIDKYVKSGHIFQLESPIQSANNRILKLMDRKVDVDVLHDLLKSLQGRDTVEFETHIIAGFPSETNQEFQDTIDFISLYKPKWVLVSGFMSASGMAAAIMPDQIDFEEKRRRVLLAYETFKKLGIICNYDYCELAQDHFDNPLMDRLVY